VKTLLEIRPFQKGQDEEIYARVFNATFLDYDDIRTLTVPEARTMANAPSFNLDGLLFGEWNGQIAGMVQAYVDKNREEKKGFIHYLAVLPEFRRNGIAKKLLAQAIKSLKEKGMTVASAYAQTDRLACVHLYESFGFKYVRSSSLMKRNLTDFSPRTEENKSERLREVQLENNEEIALINRLDNEAFKEHFNYRPLTFEETRYLLLDTPFHKCQKAWFAMLDNQPIGYVVAGIDEGLNREKNAKYGWILNIGVLKPHRRKDVGTALMLRAMSYLKEQGMENALLYVDDQNPTHAIKLYEKVGFRLYHKNATYELQLV
jgi:ribosomal protein S18 acetylase RimI-like enzyme